jgi:hypothetical protein
MASQNGFSAITSRVLTFFGSLFCVGFVQLGRIFHRRKVFEKNLVEGKYAFFRSAFSNWQKIVFP